MTDRTTLLTMLSAFVLALLCVLERTRDMLPFSIIAAGGHVADTLFHEMGHTVFFWLFGHPAIPMIFTLFGADQAGGMSMQLGHSVLLQMAMLAGLGYAAWRVRGSGFFIPAVVFGVFILLVALVGYDELVAAYMGHGGSMLMGGYFLFRGWIYLDARNAYERWLNAFFGCFLILANMEFSYGLAFDPYLSGDYSNHVAFGITHNDFKIMSFIVRGWSVKGIAIFTMGFGLATAIGATVIAYRMRDDFEIEGV